MTTKISFRLPASVVDGADQAILLGEFNNWNVDEGIWMQKESDGSMVAELALTSGRTYEYRYLLSDGRWVNDDSNKQFSEVFGHVIENCIVNVPLPEKKPSVKKATVKNKKAKVNKEEATDDLTKIEGIGKKIAGLLHDKGIKTFKNLASCTIKKLQLILDEAGSKFAMHNPASWPKQAKLAAAGKWDELNALQQELTAGK